MVTQVDATALFTMLDSGDSEQSEEIRSLIEDSLSTTSREGWLVNGLVDYYMGSQSTKCLQILVNLREPHDKPLFDKLSEHMKGPNKLQTLSVLGHLVCKQPPWLHKIVSHSLLSAVIKCLKNDTDVPILMSAVLTLTALLPVLPCTIAPHLGEIFDIFTRLSSFSLKKPGNVPEIYLVHLQVGVYSLFHRLYGMYPCNFLTYLRNVFSKPENLDVFEEIVKPMLERVRMHPLLVTSTKEGEVGRERWRQQELEEIIFECAKLSLDLIEGSGEDSRCPILAWQHQSQQQHNIGRSRVHQPLPLEQETKKPVSQPLCPVVHSGLVEQTVPPSALESSVGLVQTLLSRPDAGYFFSPSAVCGLSTPPPASKTPSNIELHVTSSSTQGTPRVTPHNVSSSDTPVIQEDQTDKTPGASSQLRVKKEGPSLTLVKTELITGGHTEGLGGSVPPSPLKSDFTAEPPLNVQKLKAIRKINFKPGHAVSVENVQESAAGVALEMEETPGPPEEIETAVAAEAEEDTTSSTDPKSPISEEKEQLGLVSSDPASFFPVSLTTSASASAPPPRVHSLAVLPQLIESLQEQQDIGDKEEDDMDLEVINITKEQLKDESSASESGSSYEDRSGQPQLTAESVAQFMKRVNRIRFNSINMTNNKAKPLKKLIKSSSCPNLETKERSDEIVSDSRVSDQEETVHEDTVQDQVDIVANGDVCNVTTATVPTVTTTVTSASQVNGEVGEMEPSEDQEDWPANLPHAHLFPLVPSNMWFVNTGEAPHYMRDSAIDEVTAASVERTGEVARPAVILGKEVPVYTTFSPPDLLDRHLELGGEVHAKELSKIPLTSQGTISWTHFGGTAPADEVNILQGQILLLHTQLMFERHKREQHAKRNRRLLRKIVNTTTLEERNAAMQDALRLQEQEIQHLQFSVKEQKKETQQLREARDRAEYERQDQLKSLQQEKESLENTNAELKSQLECQRQRNDRLTKEVQLAESKMFNLEQDLEAEGTKARQAEQLQQQVHRLNKELLLMGEYQQKCQQKLTSLSTSQGTQPETQSLLEAYKTELNSTKQCLEHRSVQLESCQARLAEVEETLKSKELMIGEQKKMIENMGSLHREQKQVLEEKYQAQKKIQQTLQSQLLEVFNQVGVQQKAEPRPAPPHRKTSETYSPEPYRVKQPPDSPLHSGSSSCSIESRPGSGQAQTASHETTDLHASSPTRVMASPSGSAFQVYSRQALAGSSRASRLDTPEAGSVQSPTDRQASLQTAAESSSARNLTKMLLEDSGGELEEGKQQNTKSIKSRQTRQSIKRQGGVDESQASIPGGEGQEGQEGQHIDRRHSLHSGPVRTDRDVPEQTQHSRSKSSNAIYEGGFSM